MNLDLPFDPTSQVLEKHQDVILSTDGGYKIHQGVGGWAYVLRYKEHYREDSGHEFNSTNNRMELRAVVEGLKAIKHSSSIIIRTDSHNTIAWCKPEYFSKINKRIKFPEAALLADQFHQLAQNHVISWQWVKGHDGDQDNGRCDYLANRAMKGKRSDSAKGAPIGNIVRFSNDSLNAPLTKTREVQNTSIPKATGYTHY